MKIYSNLNLFGNTVDDFKATNMVISGGTGTPGPSGIGGGLRYNTSDHVLEYHNGTTWTALASAVTPEPVYANGVFRLDKGTNASNISTGTGQSSNADWPFELQVDADSASSYNDASRISFGSSDGEITVLATPYTSGTSGTPKGYTVPISSQIIKYSEFTISNSSSSPANKNVVVTISHGLGTPNLQVSVYKVIFANGTSSVAETDTYEEILCDVGIDSKTNQYAVKLSFTNLSIEANKSITFLAVIVGSKNAVSVNNTQADINI